MTGRRYRPTEVPQAAPGFAWIGTGATGPDGAAPPRLLLLCDYRPYEAATVIEHIDAIRRWSRNSVYVLPMHGELPDGLDLDAFDGVLIHYSLVMAGGWYVSPLARWRISRYRGVKAAFIQDEYRFVDDTVGVMATLGINVLFSCVPPDEVEKVYPRAKLPSLRRVVHVLTGYVPEALLAEPIASYQARPIDVGYRGRRLPPWLGELAQEKAWIGERFLADASRHGLTVDISCSEQDRLYGQAWTEFISRSKAVLGVESGASVFDFDGSIERAVRAYQSTHPDAGFRELQERFFAGAEGRIRLNQISPRNLEAAALGTLMILYPGDYSGVLEPWRHYVPLAKDHSNMDEVVGIVRDPVAWSEITARARSEVALRPSLSYRALAGQVDDGLELVAGSRPALPVTRFRRLADQSYRRMPHTQLRAYGLSPSLNRLRLVVGRGVRLVRPSAVAIAPAPEHAVERLHRLRSAIRLGRAIAYWAAKPGTVPRAELVRGDRSLLEELADLRRLQELGQRAIRTSGASPFMLLLDRDRRELTLVTHKGPSGWATESLPADLSWATTVRLDLRDPWLVPMAPSERWTSPLDAVSALLRARPEAGRRLIIGGQSWCAFATVGDSS